MITHINWPPKAVLFDLDGTLLDSAADLALAVNRMRETRGLTAIDEARYRPHVGSGARGLLPIGFGIGPDDQDFPAMREEFFDTYEKCIGQRTQPFEGVAPLLRQLASNGMLWGIVTNKIERFALPVIAQAQSLSSAAIIIAGDTTAHQKPHPEPLLEAARRLKIAPTDCIYVGDDRRDMLAGKSAGMGTVAASYGYIASEENIDEWPADHRIHSPMELATILGIE